ncbi:MAG: type VI secretion system baseplate subunit TssF, partial [Planctomycetaceae bacterium]|nr:type VI secretion system baseplate subunit TssF [Planctomycetaceae bacterium]
TGLTPSVRQRLGSTLEISILLSEHDKRLEDDVTPSAIRTGCTPVINLFSRTADAIPLNHRTTEYRIIADARAEDSLEVFSVDSVTVDELEGEPRSFSPFYSVSHETDSEGGGYWLATRRPGPVEGDSGLFRNPSEMYVSLLDPAFSPWNPGRGLLHMEVTCFNRSLPEMMSHRRDSVPIRFDFAGASGPVTAPECLVAPTPVLRNHMGRKNLWPLVSQLTLNHLSLTGGADSVAALHEILRLNDPKDSVQTTNLIHGVRSITAGPCVQRMQSAFVRGTEIRLLLDDENFAGDSAYLFSTLLNQFFSMYTSINSFSRLAATTQRRQTRGLKAWTWPVKTGDRPLI